MDTPTNNYELHIFADASAKAHSCASYLCTRTSSTKDISIHLIFSKTRIVKPDIFTIPKMELFAVVLAIRTLTFVKKALPIEFTSQTLWSDSKCVTGSKHIKSFQSLFKEESTKSERLHNFPFDTFHPYQTQPTYRPEQRDKFERIRGLKLMEQSIMAKTERKLAV